MKSTTLACVVSVVTLIVLDALWLTVGGVGNAFLSMASKIGSIQPWKSWQRVLFAIAAYILLSAALCSVAFSEKDPAKAAARGAFLGLVIYGVYDFTNLAVFGRGYGLELAMADLCWGTFVMGISSFAGALAVS